MTDTSPATAAPPAPRWIPLVTVIIGILGTVSVVMGALIAIGAWRADVDSHLGTLDKRMDQAEANQHTYIPVLIGLSKDVSYLAERAHREDDRQDREKPR